MRWGFEFVLLLYARPKHLEGQNLKAVAQMHVDHGDAFGMLKVGRRKVPDALDSLCYQPVQNLLGVLRRKLRYQQGGALPQA